jgi:methanogenic corrinoid protein MtbC1
VQGGFTYDAAEVQRLVASQWFAVVGFSIGTQGPLSDLAKAIKAVREKSCNPSVRVLVGGRAVNDVADLCTILQADACTEDAREALRIATAFCPLEDSQHH